MTVATLFTPQITPELGANSMHIDVNQQAEQTAIDAMLYDDSTDSDFMDKQTDNTLADTQAMTETAEFRKLQKKLRRQVSWAIRDFNMIEDGDVVMVCVSGGKDSYTLLDILLLLKRIAPIHFDIVAVNLDQKQPGYPEEVLPAYLNEQGIAHYILEKDT